MFTLDTLNKLLSQPEGSLEFKRTILSMKTKIYLIIAMANEGGGYLILGVDDKS